MMTRIGLQRDITTRVATFDSVISESPHARAWRPRFRIARMLLDEAHGESHSDEIGKKDHGTAPNDSSLLAARCDILLIWTGEPAILHRIDHHGASASGLLQFGSHIATFANNRSRAS